MATNKVVTVTAASVVTGDTLEGYNFYSDQEGATPLNGGTVVTPANAAAGQTYALTDGVVHSVTAKPVGVSNGEFSAVESSAVSVDLTSASGYFANTAYGIDAADATKVSDAEYAFANTHDRNYRVSDLAYSGDFEFQCEVANADTAGMVMGISTTAGKEDAKSYALEPWEYCGGIKFSAPQRFRYIISNSLTDTAVAPTYTAGDKLRLVRVGSNLKLYVNTTELHDFGTVSTAPIYLKFSNYNTGGTKVREPKVIQ